MVDNIKIMIMSNKIGRNDKCPCGSGKKYKHCHLKNSGNSKSQKMNFSDLRKFSQFSHLNTVLYKAKNTI